MKLELKIGSKTLNIDGESIETDVAPFIKNARTFVPIRVIAENLGFTVNWNEEKQTVTITDEKPTKHKKYYENIDDCAVDFAMCYQPLSIALNREISAVITKDDNGYYYTNVYMGVENRCTIQKKGIEHISDIHTHGSAAGYKNDDEFSSDDKNSAKRHKVEFVYMASPRGNVKKHYVKENKTIIVSYDTPYDKREYTKISKEYPEVFKNVKYFREYFGGVFPTVFSIDAENNKYTLPTLAWCNEADRYIYEYAENSLF